MMRRAHLATFPPRREILYSTIDSIAPQVDKIFLCLNEYKTVPSELKNFPNLETYIPTENIKDAGKFAFNAADDDIVFTIDDDIIYPPNYVQRFLHFSDKIDLAQNTLGYQANAWVYKKRLNRHGWRNFMFGKKCNKTIKVNILGTGTVCVLGKNLPKLDEIADAAGFVDLRFSRLQTRTGINLWTLPREDGYLVNNLPTTLEESSLFQTVTRTYLPEMQHELFRLTRECRPDGGIPWEKLLRQK